MENIELSHHHHHFDEIKMEVSHKLGEEIEHELEGMDAPLKPLVFPETTDEIRKENMTSFCVYVERMLNLQDEIKEKETEHREWKKPKMEEVAYIKEQIQTFLEARNRKWCVFKDTKITLNTTKKAPTFSAKNIKPTLAMYFNGDEQKADEVIEFVKSNMEVTEKTTLSQRKIKKRKRDESEEEIEHEFVQNKTENEDIFMEEEEEEE